MSNALLTLSLIGLWSAPAPKGATAPGKNSCEYCHSEPRAGFAASVHRTTELTCTQCHGGDAARFAQKDAHSAEKGFKGRLKGRALVEACARCHADVKKMRAYHLPADQLYEYQAGAHARSVLRPGPPGSATCVSCHGAHRILRAHDTEAATHRTKIADTCGKCHGDPKLMKQHGLSSDTVGKYKGSIHGQLLGKQRNLKVPTCHDCHGSHGVTAYRAKQVAFVCGNCHLVTRNYFMQGPHFKAFESTKTGECSTCHGHHDVSMPSTDLLVHTGRGGCLQSGCHDGKRPKDRGATVARQIHEQIVFFGKRLAEAEARLRKAEREGFDVTVSLGFLKEAKRIRERLGPIIHSVDLQLVKRELNRGRGNLTEAHETLDVKLRELRDRRIIGAAALGALAVLLLLLMFKYRRLTRRGRDEA